MATTTTADKLRKQLERRIEGKRSVNGPGPHVYRFLAQHFPAADLQFVDLSIDWERTSATSRSGRIFLVTAAAVAFIDYENAPDEAAGEPDQNFGRANVAIYPKAGAGVESLRWSVGSLAGPAATNGSLSAWIDAKSIAVSGKGWSVDLPFERMADWDGYFARLRDALGI